MPNVMLTPIILGSQGSICLLKARKLLMKKKKHVVSV